MQGHEVRAFDIPMGLLGDSGQIKGIGQARIQNLNHRLARRFG
jgi:hypothetical protein